jgi:hypothetical protein
MSVRDQEARLFAARGDATVMSSEPVLLVRGRRKTLESDGAPVRAL